MRFGSLFSGCGGMDLGLERAGFVPAWQVEVDRACREVLTHRWPDLRRESDARTVAYERLGSVDLLAAGFPCQDLSVAGRRRGLAGERSSLFWEVVRCLSVLAPRWVLIENVPNLLSINGGRDFATVLRALGELGYWWTYRCLDAQYFGVPQRRLRLFLVGHLGAPCPPEVLLESDRLPMDPPPRREAGQAVASLLAGGAHGRGWRVGADEAAGGGLVASTLGTAHSANGDGCGRGRGNRGYGLLSRAGVRRLTPRECERLQGLPDDWTRYRADGRKLSDSARYRMIGNAVAAPVAEWIGRRILTAATRLDSGG